MGITRSDYMLDAPDGALPTARIKQVEINTISVSFASLGTSTTALHRYACGMLGLVHLTRDVNYR
jgi:glutathione synthase